MECMYVGFAFYGHIYVLYLIDLHGEIASKISCFGLAFAVVKQRYAVALRTTHECRHVLLINLSISRKEDPSVALTITSLDWLYISHPLPCLSLLARYIIRCIKIFVVSNQIKSKQIMTLNLISNIPVEITSLIFSFLDSLSMYRCSQACKKWRAIAGAEEYWEAKCLEGLSHIPDAKTTIKEIQKECSDASKYSHTKKIAIAYPNLKVLYIAFLERNKEYLGLYHKDYSFYMGGLIRIRMATRQERIDLSPSLIIGEAIICPNNDDDEMQHFSLLPAIEIHQLKNSRVTSRILFGIGGGGRGGGMICCFSKGVKFVHDAVVVNVEEGGEAATVAPLDMSLQGIMSRIQKNEFPTGAPDPITGLWTFPNFTSEQTLYSFTQTSSTTSHHHHHQLSAALTPTKSKIISLTCDKKCHQNRVRASGGHSGLLEYTTKLSKINVQHMDIPRPAAPVFYHHNTASLLLDLHPPRPPLPRAGVWMANYATHGNELSLLTYHYTHPDNQDAEQRVLPTCFTLHKITGDMNVPRGEETVTVSDLSSHSSAIGRGMFDISQSREFGNNSRHGQDDSKGTVHVYKGKARIAMEGYWNANYVDCDVIVRGQDEFFVYWYGLFEEEQEATGAADGGGMGFMSRYVFQDL